MRRLLVLLPLVGLYGCVGEVPDRDGEGSDGGVFDAPLSFPDARIVDAPLGTPDARVFDARVADAAASCTSGGRTGVCLNMSTQTCSGMWMTGLCPGPVNIVCCLPTADANTFSCNETDMPTPNVGLDEPAGEGGCPAGMLRIGGASGFCVDKYEAFLELSDGQGGFTAWSPYFNPGSRAVVARSAANAVPQGYISGMQALQACSRAGKRLCTNEEWLRACQGPSGLTYPYGNTRMPGVCNDARALHPAVELFGSVTKLSSPCINQLHDSLARAGANAGCVTAEGAVDMMGNLHEWTSEAAGTFRGGFYVDTVQNGNGCLYRTTAHDTAYSDYSTGFRCCMS